MKIDEALAGVVLAERSNAGGEVNGIQYDSRRLKPGDLFVAMRGGSIDGNKFIPAAIECGATAIVTDSREIWNARASLGIPLFLVDSGRRALAGIAANLLGHPEQALAISAVTGTNGKTTAAWLLEQMLRSVRRTCILIGTIEMHIVDEVRPSEHTTPEASDLLQVFADGVSAGATEAVMEMSSHALEQERVWGVPVDVAIFTNLTQDHLDYHGTMDRYSEAKARMFKGVGAAPPRVAVINVDDAFGGTLARTLDNVKQMTYGLEATGSYRAERIQLDAHETRMRLCTPEGAVELRSELRGRVNVYNLLAASCAALARGLSLEQIAEAARNLKQVPGRFQTVPNERDIHVVVDYAHTDDALRNLIALAGELVKPRDGRVITVFGCGGDRDRTKRPKMGRAAGQGSDLVVLTSDNPRSENPQTILDEALIGVRETSTPCIVEIDRTEAIRLALHAARPNDLVLIAGKGHEKVQILKTGTVPFDDVAVAAALLKEMQ